MGFTGHPARLLAAGLAAVALAGAAVLGLRDLGAGADRSSRGVVLLVLDTLRADRLSAYGHERPTSPAIDALAARGVLFEQVVSNASWTLPALTGLLSGRYPTRAVFDRRLAASLVESFAAAGFATAGFTEGGYFSRAFGLDRGFADYAEEESAIRLTIRGRPYHESAGGGIDRTFERAERWLAQHGDGPFLLVVHTYEVHVPYRRLHYARGLDPGVLEPTLEQPHVAAIRRGDVALGPEELAYVDALYDGGVRRADARVARFLAALERLGLADTTAVAVTSDHGEDLGARDPRFTGDHGHALYDELVRVPFVLVDPLERFPVSRVPQQVRSVDLLPTLLDVAGLPVPDGLDGRSLLPLARGEDADERPAFAEVSRFPPMQLAWRRGGRKLIVTVPASAEQTAGLELYDLVADPGERRDLAAERPGEVAALDAELRAHVARLAAEGRADYASPETLPRDVTERLESLGYVQ